MATALKVARFGISSVMSLVDDSLLEALRAHYLAKHRRRYDPIPSTAPDARASRVTAYCDMVHDLVMEQFEALRSSSFKDNEELRKYFELLPDTSSLKMTYRAMLATKDEEVRRVLEGRLRERMKPGSIDVNIMTKLDKANRGADGSPLPAEGNDAHASLRGFANSKLESSVIFSAGMNPRLYSYLASFEDFKPRPDGTFRKKVVIKVSDFRSAFIQGRFLAKKGIWVSEYRIESGLNCGGHAFATDGYLLGPILEEFKTRRSELIDTTREIYAGALASAGRVTDLDRLEMNITAQGGVGTAQEQELLLEHYHLQSVGWGSPFLLVPEATDVDPDTLRRLCEAGESDLYLSDVSPLGVPFNNLRGNSKDTEKAERVERGKPGSPCTRKFLELSTEVSEQPLCSASISFLKKKITNLTQALPNADDFKAAYNKAVDKACLCEGLISTALSAHKVQMPKMSSAVSVCPGPNLAYFSNVSTLREMVDHIYGRFNVMHHPTRPNMFIKELHIYVDYFFRKVDESMRPFSAQTEEYLRTFRANMLDGIAYYRSNLPDIFEFTGRMREMLHAELDLVEARLASLMLHETGVAAC